MSRRISIANAQQLASYGQGISPAEVRHRVLRALERRVLSGNKEELRGYFEVVIAQIASPFAGAGEDDAISSSSDEDIEQTALVFCHYDLDGDGLLSLSEFMALAQLAEGETGQTFSDEHVERCFQKADVDANGVIDFNELMLYSRRSRS